MSQFAPETAIPVVVDRNFPIDVFEQAVRGIADSKVVDGIQMWDQMTGWNPRCLWTPDRTPLARAVPDLDSFADWFPMMAYAAAIAPELNSVISLDTIRRNPAELVQTMLTLANITKGRATFHVGAGEMKQIQPFGHDAKQKMGRLEDFYRIFDAFRSNNTTPVDFVGKYIQLDQAWLGVARNHIPKIYGLGGGPKVVDLATSYADGFSTMGVMVWSDPERTAEEIGRFKQKLSAKGRDPEQFGFAAYFPCLLHEDDSVIDRALDHDFSRWHATIWGRINQADWAREGLPAPMGENWHYANDLLPVRINEAQALEMINRSTRAHVEKSYLYGAPEKVAAEIQGFVDAGVTWVGILDVMPAMLTAEEGPQALGRSIKLCELLKTAAPHTPSVSVAGAPR
jgi:phthiodiolone/phenolphthiodiolone dimycocerosates ketoreductase